MIIAGFQKVSLIDYPGKIASVIFTQGCNFRCPFCHNPELVLPEIFNEPLDNEMIFSFLKKRVEQIDGVVIGGGEPTIQDDIVDFIIKIKELNYLVKLDTNGSNPDVIETLLCMHLLDFIAMDIKAPLEKYENITKTKFDTLKINKSINLILNSNIEYEFRTTLVKSDLTNEDVLAIGNMIKNARNFTLQRFIPSKSIDSEFIGQTLSPPNEDFALVLKGLNFLGLNCSVR